MQSQRNRQGRLTSRGGVAFIFKFLNIIIDILYYSFIPLSLSSLVLDKFIFNASINLAPRANLVPTLVFLSTETKQKHVDEFIADSFLNARTISSESWYKTYMPIL